MLELGRREAPVERDERVDGGADGRAIVAEVVLDHRAGRIRRDEAEVEAQVDSSRADQRRIQLLGMIRRHDHDSTRRIHHPI